MVTYEHHLGLQQSVLGLEFSHIRASFLFGFWCLLSNLDLHTKFVSHILVKTSRGVREWFEVIQILL